MAKKNTLSRGQFKHGGWEVRDLPRAVAFPTLNPGTNPEPPVEAKKVRSKQQS